MLARRYMQPTHRRASAPRQGVGRAGAAERMFPASAPELAFRAHEILTSHRHQSPAVGRKLTEMSGTFLFSDPSRAPVQ
jgi:hypothetical protein